MCVTLEGTLAFKLAVFVTMVGEDRSRTVSIRGEEEQISTHL